MLISLFGVLDELACNRWIATNKSGIVKAIREGKTYGFIKQDDGGEDLFFHKIGVVSPAFEELREGMPVEYMIADTPKGGRAIGVVSV